MPSDLERARSDSLLFPEEAQEEVLRADVVVLQRPRFVLSEDDDLTGALREALEHALSLFAGLTPP